mmetsp:Transcript_4863/g.7195  ORF Transcript_4863/g.7195 Transcript_4863/m.7195 type:complete len:651 (+) Transcript_4863:33-1985(+)
MVTSGNLQPDLKIESKGIHLESMIRSPDSYIYSNNAQLNLSPEVMSMISEYQLENDFHRQKYEYTPEPSETNKMSSLYDGNSDQSRNATPSYQDILQHHIDSTSTTPAPSRTTSHIISSTINDGNSNSDANKMESKVTLSLEEEEKLRRETLFEDAATTVYAKQAHFPKRRTSNSSFFHKTSPSKPKDPLEALIQKISTKEVQHQKKKLSNKPSRRYIPKNLKSPRKSMNTGSGLFVRTMAPNKVDDYSPYENKSRKKKSQKRNYNRVKTSYRRKSTLPPLQSKKFEDEIKVEPVISAPTITPHKKFMRNYRTPQSAPSSNDYGTSPVKRLNRTPRTITYGSPKIKSPITTFRVGTESPLMNRKVVIKTPTLNKRHSKLTTKSPPQRILSGRKKNRPTSSSSTSSTVTRSRLTDDLLSLDFKHDDAYTPLPLYIRDIGNNVEYQTLLKYMEELEKDPQCRLVAYKHLLLEMEKSDAFCECIRESGALVVLMKRFNDIQVSSKGNPMLPHFTELLPLLQILSILCSRNVRHAELFVRLGGVNKLIFIMRNSIDVLLKSKCTLSILQNFFNDRPIIQHEFRALSGIPLFFWLAQKRASAHDISKLSQYLSIIISDNQASLEVFQSLGGIQKFKSFIPLKDIIKNRERGGFRG